MKSPEVLVLFVLAAVAGFAVPETVSAESENSVNLGFGGVPALMQHCKAHVYIVEYEHLLTPRITLLGRGSGVNYRFDDSEYVEQGKPRGMDVGARYYPDGGMKGFFVGGTVGYWKADWTFKHDKGRPNETQGNGETDSLRVNFDMGGRFPLGSSAASIIPAVNIGRYFPTTSCEYSAPASLVGTACGQETEVKSYIFLSVMAGIGF